nr:hypothetical protein [Tanacetum cinerariifolium]
MIAWIMKCVSSILFSLSINGSLHGFFKGKLGLHQGDPLSPYLFTLIMEVFTLMLQQKVLDDQSFMYHRYCSKLDLINLCFADDLFIFAHGDTDSVRVIMDGLDEFKDVFGLVPSLPKSLADFCNVLNHTKIAILYILPLEEGRLPIKYLGVSVISTRLVYKDCKELTRSIRYADCNQIPTSIFSLSVLFLYREDRLEVSLLELLSRLLRTLFGKKGTTVFSRNKGEDEVVPKVDDVSLVEGFFNGAFGEDGDKDFVMGEGVVVTSS